MAQFHFVEDYERLVTRLCEQHPIDEAMSLAVGGGYELIGQIESNILVYAGLKNGMRLIDVGCGSGRLASALTKAGAKVDYLGTDIVQKLLDYAILKSDPSYKFQLHRELSIPAANASADVICAFSVFTHLLHHETYLYLEDMRRTLRPGGKLVFSFLELAEESHWSVFEATVEAQRQEMAPHLNSFIERNAIKLWAKKLGFGDPIFISATQGKGECPALGQSVAILETPNI
jgi:ubiquinone/menaquinone biosynthesis C-methylase UbiE